MIAYILRISPLTKKIMAGLFMVFFAVPLFLLLLFALIYLICTF